MESVEQKYDVTMRTLEVNCGGKYRQYEERYGGLAKIHKSVIAGSRDQGYIALTENEEYERKQECRLAEGPPRRRPPSIPDCATGS